MIKRLSISLRLTAWYAGISALGMAVFGVVMWFVLAHSMIAWKDRTLLTRAARAEAALQSAPAMNSHALNQRLEQAVENLPEVSGSRLLARMGDVCFQQAAFSITA